MKILVTLFLGLALQAQAYEFREFREVTLNCKAINDGYTVAKTMDIMFLEQNHNNDKSIKYVAVNHHNSLRDTGGLADPQLGTYHGISSNFSEEHNNWNFQYEIEYFTNSITVLEDDNGYKLLTEYVSDGPVEVGFYECESNVELIRDTGFINAWSRLAKAVKANVASELNIKITGKAVCGEMDPYIIGDACAYKATVLNEGAENSQITIYLSEYSQDLFKIGEELSVQAITVADFDGHGSSDNSFAAQVKK